MRKKKGGGGGEGVKIYKNSTSSKTCDNQK